MFDCVSNTCIELGSIANEDCVCDRRGSGGHGGVVRRKQLNDGGGGGGNGHHGRGVFVY